ncbi:MAG: hypothetical protein ABR559_07900 [Gemmatimonadota bacterium]
MRTYKVVGGMLLAASLGACGGGGGGGPTGPPSRSIQGSYDVDHTIVFNLGGFNITFECTGTLVVITAGSGTFAGTLELDPCDGVTDEPVSGPVTGTVAANGALTLQLSGQAALVEVLEEEGCTVISADEAYAGSFTGSRIVADYDAVASCDGTQLNLHFELDARRT